MGWGGKIKKHYMGSGWLCMCVIKGRFFVVGGLFGYCLWQQALGVGRPPKPFALRWGG